VAVALDEGAISTRTTGPWSATALAFLFLAIAIVPAQAEPGTTTEPRIPGDPRTQEQIELDRRWPDFEALLVQKGALGSYSEPDGTIVVVVPASGTSTFASQDAAMIGYSVRVETREIELSDVARIEQMVSNVAWKPASPEIGYPIALLDERTGRMEVLTDAPADLFRDVFDEFGDKAW
jgi:hypothetical protein